MQAQRITSPLQSRGPQHRDLSVCADPASTSRVVRPGSTARRPRTSPLAGGAGPLNPPGNPPRPAPNPSALPSRGSGPVTSEPMRRSDASRSRTPRRLRDREALNFRSGRS